jgi:uncharacterized protein YdeI (YjbR/CyaY-like superfamily)
VGGRLRRPAQRLCPGRPPTRARRAAGREGVFAGLGSQNRYAILYRLQDAKKPDTRARRRAKFVAMLEAGETIYP